MNIYLILSCMFTLVMGSITGAGYLLFYRSAAIPEERRSPSRMQRLVLSLGRGVQGITPRFETYQQRLILAGFPRNSDTQSFIGIKIATASLIGMGFGLARSWSGFEPFGFFIALLAGAGFGYIIPDFVLGRLIQRRTKRLLNGIPTAIDLLILSLEAGQSLDMAIAETAREIHNGFPVLSAELTRTRLDMLASRSRAEVFQLLRERTPERELKRLAQIFIDSDRFGTSLGPALRIHVKFLRVRLRQQAQEQARKVSVKLVFPVFFLIFPAVILVTLGPAVIQIYTQLGAMIAK
jgi:tight adherence protein C